MKTIKGKSNRSKQIKRISKYEKIMCETKQMIEDGTGDHADILGKNIAALEEYYASNEWKQDFADDEAGLLPSDFKRGVLSEDGIYNLLEQHREFKEEQDYGNN